MEEKFYNYSLKFLSYRPRSEKEVRDKLKTKQVDSPVIEKIVLKLKEKKFVDDEEFAKGWIENRLRFKPRSLRLVSIELKQKGIAQELIDKLLDSAKNMSSDLDNAKKLVQKKIKKFEVLPRQEIYQKLERFLASKGFNWDTIKKSIDDTLDKGV
jgi:regulatory protein